MHRLRSLFRQQPDVVTIPGVELLSAGSHRPILGPGEITAEHLRSMVDAAYDDELRDAVLKIGHFDGRFNSALSLEDGEPAYGWIRNLRVEEDDGVARLRGDYTSVPTKLAGLVSGTPDQPAPYRSRSVEVEWNVETASGKKYPAVLSAVALMGSTKPAVQSLDDVFDLYYTAASAPTGEQHSTLLAEVNVDDIRSAYYETLSQQQRESLFVAELWLDTQADPAGGYLIVRSGDEINRVPFSLRARDGQVSFDEPERVRVQYVTAASASDNEQRHVLLVRDDGSAGMVGSDLAGQEGRRVDRDQLIQLLQSRNIDVPQDASDEQLVQLLDQAIPRAEQRPEEQQQTPPASPSPPNQPSPSPQPGTVQLSQEAWNELQAWRQQVENERSEAADQERERLVASALSDGRIRPAERDHYLSLLAEAPDQTRQLLQALQPVLPVSETGVTASDDTQQEQGSVSVLRALWPSEYEPAGTNGGGS